MYTGSAGSTGISVIFTAMLHPADQPTNSYLIIDDKITLVDTVKHYLADEMLDRIRAVVDPEEIDYVLVNHVEMDHSGSMPMVMEVAPNASIVTTSKGEKALEMHYGKDWEYMIVKTGDELENRFSHSKIRRDSYGALA